MTKYRMVYDSALYGGNTYRIERKTWLGRWVLETPIFVEGSQNHEAVFKRWLDKKRCVTHGETE